MRRNKADMTPIYVVKESIKYFRVVTIASKFVCRDQWEAVGTRMSRIRDGQLREKVPSLRN